MDTASKLSRYAKKINSDIRFIGVPKTIDNDLVHMITLGTEVLQNMLLPWSAKLLLMQVFMTTKNLSLL